MIQFLQISVSLIFFVNKVVLLIGKKTAWLIGVIAAFLAIFYFYLIGLYVYTCLEFGLIALMVYGFFVKEKRNNAVEKIINGIVILVMLMLSYFAFNGIMTVWEFVSSVLLLIGTYLLTHKEMQFGWLLYCFAHVSAAYVGYQKDQDFFVDFQIASVIVSAVGVY